VKEKPGLRKLFKTFLVAFRCYAFVMMNPLDPSAVSNVLPEMTHEPLVRCLGQKEAVALVIGTVIGTGVFLKAAIMATQTGSVVWVMLAWVVAGVLSLAGALCYAELGGLFPRAGGEYVYLREAYGDMAGFLYGWMRFWIGTPGSIAAYAVGAATFFGSFVALPDLTRSLLAVGAILTFSTINCFTVALGGRVQIFMTYLKVAMILGLIAVIFGSSLGFGAGSWANVQSSINPGVWNGWSAFGTSMIAALWAYDGWNNMPMAAGEIKDPGRSIPRALAFGMLSILGLYAAVNLAYFYALPFSEVISSYSSVNKSALPVATKAAQAAFGPVAVGILSIAFVISALGSLNGSILTGARVPFAMARDNLFFRHLGEVSHKGRSPVFSVAIQGLIASALAVSGTFDQLTDYVVFASWIFYTLSTAALFVLRRKRPGAERPFRTPLYPFLPIVFIACSSLLLLNTLWRSPVESGIGLAFLVAGIPIFYLFKRSRDRARLKT
jgi:APA family basic amino acid/polyamine antiporter